MKTTQCQVCGQDLPKGREYSKVRHEGKMYSMCCPMCMAIFQKDPARHVNPLPFSGRKR
jgi:ribosomal protein L24E